MSQIRISKGINHYELEHVLPLLVIQQPDNFIVDVLMCMTFINEGLKLSRIIQFHSCHW